MLPPLIKKRRYTFSDFINRTLEGMHIEDAKKLFPNDIFKDGTVGIDALDICRWDDIIRYKADKNGIIKSVSFFPKNGW